MGFLYDKIFKKCNFFGLSLVNIVKAFNRGEFMDADFTRIYELYSPDIYRLIYSYTLNSVDAKDILQETFLKLYNNLEKLPKDDLQIKKWLMRVAANQSKNFLKSYWHIHTKSLSDKDFNPKLSQEEKDTLVISSKIDKKYRIPIYLHYYEGYNIEEIADILKISKSAVKLRLSRAREKIKKEMER